MRADGSAPTGDTARLNATASASLLAGLAGRTRLLIASPGSRSTPLLLAARRRDDLDVEMVADERAAAFVALGAARATGRPVALVCTSGTAAGHYLPAVMEAAADRLPLVILSADRPARLHGCGSPQTTDQRGLFGTHTRLFVDLGPARPDAWFHAGQRATRAATYPIPGPVHLNVPFDEPLWEQGCEPAPPAAAITFDPGVPIAPPKTIAAVAELARGARRGVLFCGAGLGAASAGDGGLRQTVSRFSAACGWPVVADPSSGLRFVDASGRALAATGFEAAVRSEVVPAPDFVLQIGRAPLAKPVLRALSAAPVRVLIDPAGERHDPLLAASAVMCADPAQTLQALAPRLPACAPTWRRLLAEADRAAEGVLERMDTDNWEGAVARAVVGALADDDTLWVAASMPIRDVASFALSRARCRFLANRGVNGIDGLVAAAAGAARAGRRMTLLCGDVAFHHDAAGLLAAAGLQADLQIVVIDNKGGGIFGFLPISEHHSEFDRSFVAAQATSIPALCAAAGAAHIGVDSAGELRQLLRERVQGLRVITIRTDRAINIAAHERAWARCGDAIRAAVDGSAR